MSSRVSKKSSGLPSVKDRRSSLLTLSIVQILTLAFLSACAWQAPTRDRPRDIRQAPGAIGQESPYTGTLATGDGQGIGGTGIIGPSEGQEERSSPDLDQRDPSLPARKDETDGIADDDQGADDQSNGGDGSGAGDQGSDGQDDGSGGRSGDDDNDDDDDDDDDDDGNDGGDQGGIGQDDGSGDDDDDDDDDG